MRQHGRRSITVLRGSGSVRVPLAIAAWLVTVVAPAVAQAPATDASDQGAQSGASSALSPADSADLRSDAHDAQERFERIRVRYAPRVFGSSGGRCDEVVGRMCLTFDEDDPEPWDPPPEDSRVTEARGELLSVLDEIARRIPGDPWVLGQRVMYSGEAGHWDGALEIARDCRLVPLERWWCSALEGTALHHLQRFGEAHGLFERALAAMTEEVRAEWTDVEPMLEPGLREAFEEVSEDSAAVLTHRLWTLGDPLFIVPGRDFQTEYYSRRALAHARANARSPYRMTWGDDLTEVLVRYGPTLQYEQEIDTRGALGATSIVGHFHPSSVRFLPEEDYFLRGSEGDSEGEPELWGTADTSAKARYSPAYAPLIGAIEHQWARFRRGDELLLVLGWEAMEIAVAEAEEGVDRSSPGPLDSALFMLAEPDLEAPPGVTEVRIATVETSNRGDPTDSRAQHGPESAGDGLPRGTAWARVPAGPYLMSLEVLDSAGDRAWRARQRIDQEPLPRGLISLSDLLLLEPSGATRSSDQGGAPPIAVTGDSLEAHFHRALPGTRLTRGSVELAWEVYGLSGEEESLAFEVSAMPAERGLLRRAGEFLRLLSPVSPVRIGWTEALGEEDVRDPGAPLLRRLTVDLGALSRGPVRLEVSLRLPGLTAANTRKVVDWAPSPSDRED